ncbi:MAG TPA: hypothetical protein VN688_29635 [Gemmataceae bacterium]|nr:hypothetical protein [Gemmataceae bacterium]
MSPLTCDAAEVQAVKDALNRNPHNLGVGVLHEPTGLIHLAPFDVVPGGHAELALRLALSVVECKGFAIEKQIDGSFTAVNFSHLNGSQGQPASLHMPQATFDAIRQTLYQAGL